MKRTHKTIIIVNTLLLAGLNIFSASNSIILRRENEKLKKSINTLEEQKGTLESDYVACKWELEEIHDMQFREQ